VVENAKSVDCTPPSNIFRETIRFRIMMCCLARVSQCFVKDQGPNVVLLASDASVCRSLRLGPERLNEKRRLIRKFDCFHMFYGRPRSKQLSFTHTSGVQRSRDARGDCLIGFPPTKFWYWAVAHGGHFYWKYAVCDVTIWRQIHICKPTFWRSLL